MKKTFIVTGTRNTISTWTYEVEAESEQEAIAIVQEGDVECVNFENETDWQSDEEYSAEEA